MISIKGTDHIKRIRVKKGNKRAFSGEFHENGSTCDIEKFHDETDSWEHLLFYTASAEFEHQSLAMRSESDFRSEAENNFVESKLVNKDNRDSNFDPSLAI